MNQGASSTFKSIASIFILLFSLQSLGYGIAEQRPNRLRSFPSGPNATLTPGSLCTHPTAYRYPEHIPYCHRDVESELKRDIIRTYDRELGFRVGSMDRQQFKIDHYIPLCAGGSNEADNLWPQHVSVYEITDPLEPLICGKMSAGRISQHQAVEFIKRAKNNLTEVASIIRAVESL